jgi:hypothetical protein
LAGALAIGSAFAGWKRFATTPMSGPAGESIDTRAAEPTAVTGEPAPAAASPMAASPEPMASAAPSSSAIGAPASSARKAPGRHVAHPASPKPSASAPPTRPKVNFGF